MPGPNVTGKPKTEDYNLGRGIIYVSGLTTAGLPDANGYRDLGNATEFKINASSEVLKHAASREGLKRTDAEVILTQDLGLSFILDEINHENLALFISGSKAVHTNVAIAGFTEYKMIDNCVKGRWYDIVNSAGERAYDVLTADLTVEKSGAPDVAMVLNTDYELDSEMGRIFLMPGGVVIVDGDDIDVTLTARGAASVVNEVEALTQSNPKFALKFISSNPNNNDAKTEYQFHKSSIKPDGDYSLIGDDWTNMPFTGAAERNTGVTGSPTLTIRDVVP